VVLVKDGASFGYYAYVLRISDLVRDSLVSLGICLLIKQYFCAVYDYVEKEGRSESKNKIGG